jgi:hypothetical protein
VSPWLLCVRAGLATGLFVQATGRVPARAHQAKARWAEPGLHDDHAMVAPVWSAEPGFRHVIVAGQAALQPRPRPRLRRPAWFEARLVQVSTVASTTQYFVWSRLMVSV